MFSKTFITTTIAAAAFLALGSPAPASAISWGCPIDPSACSPIPTDPAPVVESASFNTEEAHVAPTTTVATGEVTDETPNVQATEAITASGTDQRGSFDPMMAAVFGALGSLAIVLLTLTAFAAGRRRN